MRIIGHGIDITPVGRIATMLDRHGRRFIDRCFCPDEIIYAERHRRRAEHYAARFAAKEAVLKAIGTGWRGGIAWTDIEVVRLPSGQPTLRLSGQAGRIAGEIGVTGWMLSISHTEDHAVASAIAIADD